MSRATIKRWGRPVIALLSYYGGYCLLARHASRSRILSYHGIHDLPSNPYAVSTADFTRHMEYVAQACAVLPLDDLVERLRRVEPVPTCAIAITIDDGYRDVYSHAYPVLRRLGLPATVFLPVNYIDGKRPAQATERMAQSEFVTWEQVCEMSHNGLSFGSHTLDHVSLARISPQEARIQLQHSKSRLEAALGTAVTGFAYPYGTVRDVTPEIERLVAEAGYRWAVTGLSGANRQGADLFALRRIKIERGDDVTLVARAVQGALDPWILADRLGRLW